MRRPGSPESLFPFSPPDGVSLSFAFARPPLVARGSISPVAPPFATGLHFSIDLSSRGRTGRAIRQAAYLRSETESVALVDFVRQRFPPPRPSRWLPRSLRGPCMIPAGLPFLPPRRISRCWSGRRWETVADATLNAGFCREGSSSTSWIRLGQRGPDNATQNAVNCILSGKMLCSRRVCRPPLLHSLHKAIMSGSHVSLATALAQRHCDGPIGHNPTGRCGDSVRISLAKSYEQPCSRVRRSIHALRPPRACNW